jgi:hypothetical protein
VEDAETRWQRYKSEERRTGATFHLWIAGVWVVNAAAQWLVAAERWQPWMWTAFAVLYAGWALHQWRVVRRVVPEVSRVTSAVNAPDADGAAGSG